LPVEGFSSMMPSIHVVAECRDTTVGRGEATDALAWDLVCYAARCGSFTTLRLYFRVAPLDAALTTIVHYHRSSRGTCLLLCPKGPEGLRGKREHLDSALLLRQGVEPCSTAMRRRPEDLDSLV
jgi:hypothetical protein